MKDFPIIWLLFNTKVGRILLGVLIVYVIVYLVGWWLVPIIIAFVAAVLLQDYFSRLSDNKNALKIAKEYFELQKQHQQERENEYQKILDAHPTALDVVEESKLYMTHHLYWLAIGKAKQRIDVFENDFIKIGFAIAEDRCGVIVSITNISDSTISIDWPSFVINRSRVHIDGVIYLDYPKDEKLEPNETVTKLLQPHKLYFNGKFQEMFDLKKINERVKKLDVTFNIIYGGNEELPLVLDVYALHKRIRIENVDDLKDENIDNTKLIAGIGLLVLALLFSLGLYINMNRGYGSYEPRYIKPYRPVIEDTVQDDSQELVIDTISEVKQVGGEKKEVPVSSSRSRGSSSSYRHKEKEPDNMRGFDPASEDDMDDNGMTRYMEVNDDEGWD